MSGSSNQIHKAAINLTHTEQISVERDPPNTIVIVDGVVLRRNTKSLLIIRGQHWLEVAAYGAPGTSVSAILKLNGIEISHASVTIPSGLNEAYSGQVNFNV
jgi:hypothetical protein